MFQRILVPLDGSPRAERALSVAARMAIASGGTVVLQQVVTLPQTVAASVTVQPLVARQGLNEEVAKAKRYLQHCVEAGMLADSPHLLIVKRGSPTEAILQTIDEQDIDLVVIGSHGYTGMAHWVLGSIAENVSHAVPVPVLFLRGEHPLLAEGLLQREDALRILVPLDGSRHSEEAIVPAAQLILALAAPASGALHLLLVMHAPDVTSSIGRTGTIRQAKEYLRATVRHIREGSLGGLLATGRLSLTWSVTTNAFDVAAAIVDLAEQGQKATGGDVFARCHAIAMATHAPTGQHRWTLGSVTETVLHKTKLPLLVMVPEQG